MYLFFTINLWLALFVITERGAVRLQRWIASECDDIAVGWRLGAWSKRRLLRAMQWCEMRRCHYLKKEVFDLLEQIVFFVFNFFFIMTRVQQDFC